MESLTFKSKTFSIFVIVEYCRNGSHIRYDLKIYIVWIIEYRKLALYGQVAQRLRDLVREICKGGNVTDEVILEHIKNQDKEGTDDNFQIGKE